MAAGRGASAGATSSEAWRERLTVAAFVAVGLVLSVYLAASQVGVAGAPWDPLFGSASSVRVLHSALTRLLPVPDAALGAAAYAAELVLVLAGGADRARRHPWLVLAYGALAAGLGLTGVGLTVVQAAVVRAGCTLCLCSAAISVGVAVAVLRGRELRTALGTWSRTHRPSAARGLP